MKKTGKQHNTKFLFISSTISPSLMLPTYDEIIKLQTKVLDRYSIHKRELPRRDIFDTYKVLVSEIMLQQTQVDRVIPKYLAFLESFPDRESLAKAPKTLLLQHRSWLGFNSRALRLQQCAQKVLSDYDGILPRSRETLLTLPGIWAYSSCSLLAFAYNLPAPVIDTNIRRIFISEFSLPETITTKELETIAMACIPEGKSNDRYNALMDYGSLVLTANKTGIKPVSKQSSFHWSRRQIRGKILKHLLQHGSTDISNLAIQYPHAEFSSIIDEMILAWLLQKRDTKVSIE